jgi:Putative Actinobacterial Holin-X, holin superfamily III
MASAASTSHPAAEPGLRALLGDVVDHVRALLRLELALARDEVRRALEALRHGVLLLGAAVMVGTLGLLSLMAALVAALATVWPLWLAAGAVGAVFAVTGGLLARAAISGLTLADVRPSATIETIEETRAWLKSRT